MAAAPAAGARVLRVGTYRGIGGQFKTIQAAINAAKPGDWILVGPGDYKTRKTYEPPSRPNTPAAVLITKPRLHLRGMNRNTVIIDGTNPGSSACSRKQSAQNFGPSSSSGRLGLNGVLIWKARNVSVQNLTACNFLGGSGHAGNGIWWNGGDDSAKIGGWDYTGTYLTATSMFFKDETSAAQYGIFSSNWSGGTWNRVYASNFNDSGFYIGAHVGNSSAAKTACRHAMGEPPPPADPELRAGRAHTKPSAPTPISARMKPTRDRPQSPIAAGRGRAASRAHYLAGGTTGSRGRRGRDPASCLGAWAGGA